MLKVLKYPSDWPNFRKQAEDYLNSLVDESIYTGPNCATERLVDLLEQTWRHARRELLNQA